MSFSFRSASEALASHSAHHHALLLTQVTHFTNPPTHSRARMLTIPHWRWVRMRSGCAVRSDAKDSGKLETVLRTGEGVRMTHLFPLR